MGKLPIALQLYSVRAEAEKNFVDTMLKIKSLGYDGVELAGLYGHSPEDIREALRVCGLEPISAHVPYPELAADIEKTVEAYHYIGCRYIALPYFTEEYRAGAPGFDELMADIPKIAEACNRRGMVLLYHNHDFEFEKMSDGRYVLDYIFETFSPELLQTEIDTCWANVAGVEPSGYVLKYSGRAPVVHLKDFAGSKAENNLRFKAIGYGVQDMPKILDASVKAGAEWLVVEMDEHPDNSPMTDAELSLKYLREVGF